MNNLTQSLTGDEIRELTDEAREREKPQPRQKKQHVTCGRLREPEDEDEFESIYSPETHINNFSLRLSRRT